MNFKDWLTQAKSEKPELDEFLTKINPFFTDAGFNGLEFEKRVTTGLKNIDTEISKSLIPESNVAN